MSQVGARLHLHEIVQFCGAQRHWQLKFVWLLLCVICATFYGVHGYSSVNILAPQDGSFLQAQNYEGHSVNLIWNVVSNDENEVYFTHIGLRSHRDKTFSIPNSGGKSMRQVTLKNIGFGTHVINIDIISDGRQIATTTVAFNIVPPVSSMATHFSEQTIPSKSVSAVDETCFGKIPLTRRSNAVTISFVGNTAIDGQRTIWLDLIEHMPSSDFTFNYISFWGSTGDCITALQSKSNVRVKIVKITSPLSRDGVNAEGWEHNNTAMSTFLLEHSKNPIGASECDHSKACLWATSAWEDIKNAFRGTDIAVFANGNERVCNLAPCSPCCRCESKCNRV